MKDIGLTPREIDLIREVFRRFPAIGEVILYGSRAKGSHWPESDIDLALVGTDDDLQAEAIALSQQGLELLKGLPKTTERPSEEIELQITLGNALIAAGSLSDPHVGQAFTRARTLCEQVKMCPSVFGRCSGCGATTTIVGRTGRRPAGHMSWYNWRNRKTIPRCSRWPISLSAVVRRQSRHSQGVSGEKHRFL